MYIVIGLLKHSEQADYKNGCLIGTSQLRDIQVHFTNETLQGILSDLQEFTGCDDILLNNCDESGRVDLQGYETLAGYKATDNEYEAWKNAKKKLFRVTYTTYVYKAELSTLIEGY